MAKQKKNIVILGSTGSIGENAVKVISHLADRFNVLGIAAGTSIKRLAEQANMLNCRYASISDTSLFKELSVALPNGCTALTGEEGVLRMVTDPEVDMVLCAIVGAASLIPVLSSVNAGKEIALASKEALVMAGNLVMREADKKNVKIIPVDSEHSAVFQCLEGKNHHDIRRIILTASGGSFRKWTRAEMKQASLEDALAHPTWNMGQKITIDSATLMNKALEIIEAKWLFNIPENSIDVVIHHQSVIHSMVEFIDGTLLAQMSSPDMCFPIQYALTYPEKYPGALQPLNFAEFAELTFEIHDRTRFPSLDFAAEALKSGGTMPAVMNAANETAVERFIHGEIIFTDIWKIIEKTMNKHSPIPSPNLEAILDADQTARKFAAEI